MRSLVKEIGTYAGRPVSTALPVFKGCGAVAPGRSEAGLDGFYPFDLMAAAYMLDPSRFGCARVTAWVGHDALLPWFGGGPALLVTQQAGRSTPMTASVPVLYCDKVRISADELFR